MTTVSSLNQNCMKEVMGGIKSKFNLYKHRVISLHMGKLTKYNTEVQKSI